MKTRITELLNIKYPIIQGAMAWVSLPPLAAAVSNAGGLGILGASFMKPDELRENIKMIKKLTDKPYGVNFMPENPELETLLDIIIEEEVPVASYGKGNPERIIEKTKDKDIINIPTMGALKHAIKAEKDGAHAVIVQGTEGGGHSGFISTLILTTMAAEALNIPVIAAGGFGDGKGLLAALALGAEGIAMGSRFIATRECPVPEHVKEWIVRSGEEDTVVTDNLTGVRCRVLKNKFSQQLIEMKEKNASPWELLQHAKGRFKRAFDDGDLEEGSLACGQVAGLIHDIPSCKDLIERTVQEARQTLPPLKDKVLPSPV